MGAAEVATPARGRPRDPARDAAILEATLRLLVDLGYDQLSIEAVASVAGVGKTTIYRRYPDKASLVAAAVERRTGTLPPKGRATDLRGVLLEVVRWLAAEITGQEVGLLGALFAGMRGDPALAAAMRRILRRDQEAMTEHIAAYMGDLDSELVPDAAELFAEIAPAVITHRIVVAGQRCDRRFAEHLVDDILLPLLRRERRAAGARRVVDGRRRPASTPRSRERTGR